MAKYKVLETSFIDNRLVQPGEVVEWDGEAGSNLEAIDAPSGRRRKGDASESQEGADQA